MYHRERSAYGEHAPNTSMVLFDLSLSREKRRGVRALPISSVEDATPRSIAWTKNGLQQPTRGIGRLDCGDRDMAATTERPSS